MNFSLALLAGFVLLLLVAAWRRPALLFFLWPIVLLVLPTVRTLLAGAPIYWFDVVTLILLGRLYWGRELTNWPAQLPVWHWWFVCVALLFGTLVPLVRYGAGAEMLWIFGHAALAWMAFPVGVALTIAPRARQYRGALTVGLVFSLAMLAVVAVLQFGNETMAHAVNSFFYRDMEGHLLRAEEGGGAVLSASRANGPFGDPNTFGGTTAIACAICLLLGRSVKSRLALAAVVSAAIVVGATVSRQVLVAAAIGMLVALALGSGAVRLRVIGTMVVVLTTALVGGVAERWGARLAKWEGGVTQDENVIGRIVYGPQRLIALISYDPSVLLVGAGLDVQKLVKKSGESSEELALYNTGGVSNGFLLPLYYMGIAGFAVTLAFWISALRRALAQPRAQRALATACVVGAMALIFSDNYASAVEASVAMLSLLGAIVAGRLVPEAGVQAPITAPAAAATDRRFPNLLA